MDTIARMMHYNKVMQTGNILRKTMGLMFLVVLVACNAPAFEQLSSDTTQTAPKMNIDSPTVTVTANQNWVIIAEDHAEKMDLGCCLAESEAFWTPSIEDILNLEEGIAEYLSQNSRAFYNQPPVWERLDEYQRQYIGFERSGRSIIYGNYFCNNVGRDWRQQLVFVIDGGECFFQVEYDVESGLFTKLMVNVES